MPIPKDYRTRPAPKARRVPAAVFQRISPSKRKPSKREFPLEAKNGQVLFLRKPLAAGGIYREKRKPAYWRSLSLPLAGGNAVPEARLNDWLLILTAKKIPYSYSIAGDRPRLYVPPLYEDVALYEIRAFEQERSIPTFVPPKRDNIPGVLLFLLLLAIWHGLRWGWFDYALPSPPFPEDAKAWAPAFGLDVYRATTRHEWWRAVTALTLHADEAHLFSNIGFGLIFLGALCRRAGLGLGVLLAIIGGIGGNVCNALTRAPNVLSIGFSTALFAALGAHCALAGADIIRHMRRHTDAKIKGKDLAHRLLWRISLPLAAGVALLGLLGGGGEARTDYPAHIWGFFCGILVCTLLLPLEKKLLFLSDEKQPVAQGALFAAGLVLLSCAWGYALLFAY